LSGFNPKPW